MRADRLVASLLLMQARGRVTAAELADELEVSVATARRDLEARGLVGKDDVWYLVAGTEDGQRTFRVDRVIDALVTDLAAERPADFDLSVAWERVVDEVEHQRSLVSATVLIDATFLPVLRTQFGRQCEVDGTLDGGRVRARLAAPAALMIAQHLAGWGAAVEVVEPESVRAELARLGWELAKRYIIQPGRTPRARRRAT